MPGGSGANRFVKMIRRQAGAVTGRAVAGKGGSWGTIGAGLTLTVDDYPGAEFPPGAYYVASWLAPTGADPLDADVLAEGAEAALLAADQTGPATAGAAHAHEIGALLADHAHPLRRAGVVWRPLAEGDRVAVIWLTKEDPYVWDRPGKLAA